MKERILSNAIRALCVSGFALTAQAAYAQQAPAPSESVQTVQVTGSRLTSSPP